MIGMYGLTRAEAVQRLIALIDLIEKVPFSSPAQPLISVTFHAGVAQYPEDGLDMRSLYLAAIADRENMPPLHSTCVST